MNKAELRKLYLEKRAAIPADVHAALSEKTADRFFDEIDLDRVGSIHCYLSLEHRGEIETDHIFGRLWREFPHIRTFAPRIDDETGEMIALQYVRETSLEQNKWHILEPAEGDPSDPAVIDLVVVPLLCFDESGMRVGYGKGFYDRFLRKCRPDCVRAGLSFFPPVERIEDVHEGDVPLDICFTPTATYRFPKT